MEYEACYHREVSEFMSTLAQRVFHEVGVIAEAIGNNKATVMASFRNEGFRQGLGVMLGRLLAHDYENVMKIGIGSGARIVECPENPRISVAGEGIEDYRFPALIGTYLLFALLASKYRVDQEEYVFIQVDPMHVPLQSERLLGLIIEHMQPGTESELGYRDIMGNLFPKRPNEQVTQSDLNIPHCLVGTLEFFSFEPKWLDW